MKSFLLYFGCWGTPGHFLWDRNRQTIYDPLERFGPHVIRPEDIDGSRILLPTPDRPGRGRLTHIVRADSAVTVLAWWDRTFDQRPACCAAIQSSGWDDDNDLWLRFSHVYEPLAKLLTRPELTASEDAGKVAS